MITLYINHFHAYEAARRTEYEECLRRNCDVKAINRIIILAESTPQQYQHLDHHKIVWVPVNKRPQFKDFFETINSRCDSKELSIVANSDIFFDESLARLEGLELNNICLALARWEYDLKSGSSELKVWDNSQDGWIFQGRIRSTVKSADFELGRFSCDWRIAWELEHGDYTLLNPCHDIKLHHIHPSGINHNLGNVGGPSAYVTRRTLASCNLRRKQSEEHNVISYSLFGNKDKYTQGAIENLKIAKYLYPGWTCRFYVDNSVPEDIRKQLAFYGGDVVYMPDSENWRGLFWRFLVGDERGFDRWMIRDCDSRLGYRERRAVDDWIESGLPFHVIKDHIYHGKPIMGCAFGAVKDSLPSLRDSIDAWQNKGRYGDDEEWLAQVIGPQINGRTLIHDAYAREHIGLIKSLPTPLENYRYVGERIHHDERHEHGDRKALSDYLYDRRNS